MQLGESRTQVKKSKPHSIDASCAIHLLETSTKTRQQTSLDNIVKIITMEGIKDQVTSMANESDARRQQVMKALQDLLLSFETTEDTIHRYGHMVSQLLQPSQPLGLTSEETLQSAVVQVGINLGLFKYLSQHDKPLTIDEISEKCKTDSQLMGESRFNIRP